MLGRCERGARHLPASRRETPELEIRHRCRVRGSGVGAIGLHHPLDRGAERLHGRGKLPANRCELRPSLFAELIIEFAHLGDHGKSRLAAVTRGLAADQIVGLDAGRALVDGDDARVAVMLRGAGFLDEANAAVDLHAGVGNLLRGLGAPALDDRNHQVDERLVALSRLRIGVRVRVVERAGGHVGQRAHRFGLRPHRQ